MDVDQNKKETEEENNLVISGSFVGWIVGLFSVLMGSTMPPEDYKETVVIATILIAGLVILFIVFFIIP